MLISRRHLHPHLKDLLVALENGQGDRDFHRHQDSIDLPHLDRPNAETYGLLDVPFEIKVRTLLFPCCLYRYCQEGLGHCGIIFKLVALINARFYVPGPPFLSPTPPCLSLDPS